MKRMKAGRAGTEDDGESKGRGFNEETQSHLIHLGCLLCRPLPLSSKLSLTSPNSRTSAKVSAHMCVCDPSLTLHRHITS